MPPQSLRPWAWMVVVGREVWHAERGGLNVRAKDGSGAGAWTARETEADAGSTPPTDRTYDSYLVR